MKRRVHLKATPVSLKKLVDNIGIEDAAIKLGTSTWNIRRHINKDQTSPPIELAAKSLLSEPDDESIAIVKGDNATLQMVQRLMKMSNGDYTVIK